MLSDLLSHHAMHRDCILVLLQDWPWSSEAPALAQMLSDSGHQSILTGPTASAGWKSVRKGVMPAFSPQNIRSAVQSISLCLQALIAELDCDGQISGLPAQAASGTAGCWPLRGAIMVAFPSQHLRPAALTAPIRLLDTSSECCWSAGPGCLGQAPTCCTCR